MIAGHKEIFAPEDNIVLSCSSPEEEAEIAKKLSSQDINFRRSNNDIEVMTINAKNKFYEEA